MSMLHLGRRLNELSRLKDAIARPISAAFDYLSPCLNKTFLKKQACVSVFLFCSLKKYLFFSMLVEQEITLFKYVDSRAVMKDADRSVNLQIPSSFLKVKMSEKKIRFS